MDIHNHVPGLTAEAAKDAHSKDVELLEKVHSEQQQIHCRTPQVDWRLFRREGNVDVRDSEFHTTAQIQY